MFHFKAFKNITYVIVTYYNLYVGYFFQNKILYFFETDPCKEDNKKY